MSGFIYRACSGGLFNNTTGEYDCYGPLAQSRLAPYHQLDLRAEKAWDKKTYKIAVYLDVINAYFHNSPDAPKFNYDLSGVRPISRSLPLIPSFGVRGEL